MVKLAAFEYQSYKKLFELFKRKYYSFGEMRGTVSLATFNAEEIEEIAGFLAVSAVQLTRKGNVSLQQFEKQLQTSAYKQYSLKQLVEIVLNDTLVTKQGEQVKKLETEERFVASLQVVLQPLPAWYHQIMKKHADSRFIWQQQQVILNELEKTANALSSHLPNGQFERLPIFAQRTTGNPHAFDAQTVLGRLLLHAAFSCHPEEIEYPKTTEERVDTLAMFGIVQDDLWNFVTCQGLRGYQNNGPHQVWQAAIEEQVVLNVPMRELMRIEKIEPVVGKQIWVVENSSVASTLMDAHPTLPIVCTHGQFRMASWRLFDLVDEQTDIYYSGDLDPEGLLIAQRLARRYGQRVKFWRMDERSFEKGISENLTEIRLAKLQHVEILPQVVSRINATQKAAYQEAWLDDLVNDLYDE